MQKRNNHERVSFWIVAALVLCIFLTVAGVSSQFKPTPDSCLYLGTAQSIARGHGPVFNGYENCIVPPLVPLTLTTWVLIADQLGQPNLAVWLSKLWLIFMASLLALGSWRLALHYMGRTEAALVALAVLSNIGIFQHCMFIVTEIPYLCLSVWTLVFLNNSDKRSNWIAGGLMLTLTLLTKAVAVAMIAALVLWLVFGNWHGVSRKKYLLRAAYLLPLSVMPLLAWKMYYGSPERGYTDILTALIDKPDFWVNLYRGLLENFAVIFSRNTQMVLNIERTELPLYFSALLFLLLFFGWFQQLLYRRSLPEWYMLTYYSIMIFWWYDQGVRYFLPLLPLQIIYGITAVKWIWKKLHAGNLRLSRWVIVPLLIVSASALVWELCRSNHLDSVVDCLRSGHIYLLMALPVIAVCLGVKLMVLSSNSARKIVISCLLIVYFGTGWLYFIGFAALEHGLLKSRPPMLLGYQPFYSAGQWLAEQEDVGEPVLCLNKSLIFLPSGKIARHPDSDQDNTDRMLRQGHFASALLIKDPDMLPGIEMERNLQISRLISTYKDNFELVKTSKHNQYLLYRYRN